MKKIMHVTAQVALLNNGMLMGDEEALQRAPYTRTTRCRTHKAEVLQITAFHFNGLVTELKRKQRWRSDLEEETPVVQPVEECKEDDSVVIMLENKVSKSTSHGRRHNQKYLLKREDFYLKQKVPREKVDELISSIEQERNKIYKPRPVTQTISIVTSPVISPRAAPAFSPDASSSNMMKTTSLLSLDDFLEVQLPKAVNGDVEDKKKVPLASLFSTSALVSPHRGHFPRRNAKKGAIIRSILNSSCKVEESQVFSYRRRV